MQCKVGYLKVPNATGTVSVTGLGFTPTAVLFFCSRNPDLDTNTGAGTVGLGVATASGSQGVSFLDMAAVLDGVDTGRCIHGNTYHATFVSMDADGFTVNFQLISVFKAYIGYLAINPTNAKVIPHGINSSAGNYDITGAGFAPTAVIHVSGGHQLSGSRGAVMFGGATARSDSLSQAAMVYGSTPNTAAVSSTLRQGTTSQDNSLYQNAQEFYGGLVGFIADGYTYRNSYGSSMTLTACPLLMAGLSQLGQEISLVPGSSAQQVTGLGFAPSGLIIFSTCKNMDADPARTEALHCFGAIDESLNGYSHFGSQVDASPRPATGSRFSAGRFITNVSYDSVNVRWIPSESIVITSLDDDGYTIDCTGVSTASKVAVIALGPSDKSTSSLCAMGVG